MIRCLIIEDQPPAQRVLQKYIGEVGNLDLVGTFSDALEALDFIKSNPVDLLFLDIHLPKLSGMDFIKTMSHKPDIILTTAFSEYALESYEYDIVDYLLKPFSFERFVKAISKIPSKENNSSAKEGTATNKTVRKEIYIKSGYEHIKLLVKDIIYIKSDADYTEIFTPEKKYLSAEPLRFWTESLNENQFARTHKSYIVNTSKIEKIVGNQINLVDKTKIPIGRAFKEDFMKSLLR
ncbi:MAG: LytR/AlgR family response regulator transcription factor [Aurantibacter sp.]